MFPLRSVINNRNIIAQYTPDYFPVVDSGATVHVLWDSVCTAYTKESNSAIKWGGIDSHSVCTSIGHLNAVTYCKNNNNRWEMIILTSGCNDTWIIPNANRMLFSQVRAKLQGHKCILEGPNPGMLIADTNDFIPFVTEEERGLSATRDFGTLYYEDRRPLYCATESHRTVSSGRLLGTPESRSE